MTVKTVTKTLSAAMLAFGLAVWHAPDAAATGYQKGTSDWPCPQRKVDKLGASELQWEGPAIEGVKGWREDGTVNALISALANRRVPVPEAVKALKAYSDGLPAAERLQKLTLVFAGLLDTVNQYRSSIITGIERFDKRQKGRAAEIEAEGLKLSELEKKAEAGGEDAKAEYAKAQELYDWNARVFEERRQNLPLACEIPPAIDARMFDIVREMKVIMGTQPPG